MGTVIKGVFALIIVAVIVFFIYNWFGQDSNATTITDGTLIWKELDWFEGAT
jgi:preprotein translocase subunit SecD